MVSVYPLIFCTIFLYKYFVWQKCCEVFLSYVFSDPRTRAIYLKPHCCYRLVASRGCVYVTYLVKPIYFLSSIPTLIYFRFISSCISYSFVSNFNWFLVQCSNIIRRDCFQVFDILLSSILFVNEIGTVHIGKVGGQKLNFRGFQPH